MLARFRDDPNVLMLLRVAMALGDLRERLVFLGGCATSLLHTAVRAEHVRATQDVDAVVEVVSTAEYHAFEAALRKKGFRPDTTSHAPICRHVLDELRLDVMPSHPDILGFSNRWYPEAIRSSMALELEWGVVIRLVTAPAFVATKLEAFKGRGNNDFLSSHDLEDILSVVDGRDELAAELAEADIELRNYVSSAFAVLLKSRDFITSLPGHLPPDSGGQARLPELLNRLRFIAAYHDH